MVLIDSTVFSNFAYSGSIDVLIEAVDYPVTSKKVAKELERGCDEGYEFLDRALKEMPQGSTVSSTSRAPIGTFLGPESFDLHQISDEDGKDMFHELDPGEASLIFQLLVDEHSVSDFDGRPIATDDQDARQCARQFGIPVTGSVGILAKAVRDDIITAETADDNLHAWIDGNGYRSPIESVTEIL
jgi:predicted nucleic acid-binding protein